MNRIGAYYLAGREALMADCAERLRSLGLPHSALRAVFWDDFFADDAHLPVGLCGATPPKGNFTLPDFTAEAHPDIESVGMWRRLCVTTTWFLDLEAFADTEAWFASLSQKNRKKLRWLRNAVPKLGMNVSPLAGDADFADFFELYLAQFPQYRGRTAELNAVREIYRLLEARGMDCSRMLRDADGKAAAAALAYRNGDAVFYTHLTRAAGGCDKYSPGYYLTYAFIRGLLDSADRAKIFFMGPGYYDYKSALGGAPAPVFRYERASFGNLFGLIRLRHRAAKERKKSARQGRSEKTGSIRG